MLSFDITYFFFDLHLTISHMRGEAGAHGGLVVANPPLFVLQFAQVIRFPNLPLQLQVRRALQE